MALKCLEFAEANSKSQESENQKKFFGNWLKVDHPVAPSSLIWRH